MIAGVILQVRDLDDDAIMRQALNEWIRDTLFNLVIIIVQITTADIYHGMLQITHLMPQYIDGDDRQTKTFRVVRFGHIVLI